MLLNLQMNPRIVLITSLLLWIAIGNNDAYATNVGVYGQVYDIAETDLLVYIQHKLRLMQDDGQLKVLEDQFRQNVVNHAKRPPTVNSFGVVKENKAWSYDPTIILSSDIHDAQGNVVIKAGTSVNPLKMIHLHNALLFFDGDDLKQAVLASKINSILKGKVKMVLVKGSITDSEKLFNKPIYFDQEGRLTSKFNIHNVPALVEQDGDLLKISEIKP